MQKVTEKGGRAEGQKEQAKWSDLPLTSAVLLG